MDTKLTMVFGTDGVEVYDTIGIPRKDNRLWMRILYFFALKNPPYIIDHYIVKEISGNTMTIGKIIKVNF